MNLSLDRYPIFTGLTPEELNEIAPHCSVVKIERGSDLFQSGEPATSLFVVRSGRIELRFDVTCYSATTPFTLDVKSPGDVCGRSALMAPYVYTLTAHATEDSELLRIDQAGLLQCCESDPSIGYHVMKNIAGIIGQRFEVTRQMLAREIQAGLHQKDPLS